jgi:hypothetical protein
MFTFCGATPAWQASQAAVPAASPVWFMLTITRTPPKASRSASRRRPTETGREHLVVGRLQGLVFPGGEARAAQQVAVARGVDKKAGAHGTASGFVLEVAPSCYDRRI